MKNLLPVLDKLVDTPVKQEKERSDWGDRKYYRSWSAYIGKVAKVNIDNLLGLHHDEIVAKYLHTLPEEYRDVLHLYSKLNIEILSKDGTYVDPIYAYRSRWQSSNRTVYFFNKDNILCVKRKIKKKKPKLPLNERMREFYEKKQAKKKRDKIHEEYKELVHSELLRRETYKREEKEKKLNLQKIVSHGFDPITSFRPDRKPKENDK